MSLTLKPGKPSSLPGDTLFSDEGPWAQKTGIYVPPGVNVDHGIVNVVLWLHGWFVTDIEQLFDSDPAAVTQQFSASGANAILVAPYLGNGHRGGGSTYSVGGLKGNWGQTYLGQVLSALGARHVPTEEELRQRRDLNYSPVPTLRLGKLVIACHSGGGEAMRYVVGSLGTYRWNLRECWGFDCLYGINATPDDATFWYRWVNGTDGRPLYVSYGPSTVPQSVKLYLMGEGIATETGARRDPEGADVERLHVSLGLKGARYIDDLLGLDKLLLQSTPTPRNPSPLGNGFAGQAASNLSRNAGWPPSDQLMKLHYAIASDGLRERLKAASFL